MILTDDDKILILLEDIAFRVSAGILEKDQYLERLYASSQSGTTEILRGGVGPEESGQSDRHGSQRVEVKRVRRHKKERSSAQEANGEIKDNLTGVRNLYGKII